MVVLDKEQEEPQVCMVAPGEDAGAAAGRGGGCAQERGDGLRAAQVAAHAGLGLTSRYSQDCLVKISARSPQLLPDGIQAPEIRRNQAPKPDFSL